MLEYSYEKAKVNGQNGYIATRRKDGLFCGKAFGKTKAQAREAFED